MSISYCIPACYILILARLLLQPEARWSDIVLFQHIAWHCNANTDDLLRTSNMSPNYKQHRIPMVDVNRVLHHSLLYSHSNVTRIPIRGPVISHWTVLTCCSTLLHKYWRFTPYKQYVPKLQTTSHSKCWCRSHTASLPVIFSFLLACYSNQRPGYQPLNCFNML